MKKRKREPELAMCYVCGRANNLTLSPEKIYGEWQAICWPCENLILMSIMRYRSQIRIEILTGRCNLLT